MGLCMTDLDYGEDYFGSHCGIPYSRAEPHWIKFFSDVARELDQRLAPKTVFDAGCAIGFLVETLRARGIEAFGRDFSSYAIGQVPQGLKAFCSEGSIADPIEGRFDLVTCIEVVEHMPEEQARKAVQNLCAAAPMVFFSSSPTDFEEETHINVQTPLYWLRLFAAEGFGPVADFDGSFLCPWAILFEQRSSLPTEGELNAHSQLIMRRMEIAAASSNENAEIKNKLDILQNQIAGIEAGILNSELPELHREVGSIKSETTALQSDIARINVKMSEISDRTREFEESRGFFGFRFALKSRRARRNLRTKGRSPEATMVERSGLFDSDWYAAQYPDTLRYKGGALSHYFEYGAAEGRDPNAFFSTKWYVSHYPEVAQSGTNPLYHYVSSGEREGLKPNKDFDPTWYAKTYPDTVADQSSPFLHYLRHGRLEGRRQNSTDGSRDLDEAEIQILKEAKPAKELALFVTHAPAGKIKPHVPVYISALREVRSLGHRNCGRATVVGNKCR